MSRGNSGAVERTLGALRHLDTLDSGDSMSPARGLGCRSLPLFGGVYARELAQLEQRLAHPAGHGDLVLRGRLRRLRGNIAGARADLARAAAAAPRDARTLSWRAELDVVAAPKRAVRLLKRALTLDSHDGYVRLWLGQAYLELGQFALARREVDAAFGLFARPPHVLYLLRAVALFHARDLKGAAKAALAAIKDDPHSPSAYVLLSNVRHAQGRKSEALAACHDARNRDLEVGASYLLPEFGLDPWKDAASYLKRLDRAIAKRPTALLFAERGELKRDPRLCLYVEALADYEAAARLAPGAAWIRALVGRARNNASGGEAGLSDFARAIKLGPESGWIRAWRGAALARLGRTAAAVSDFTAAQRLMPWYPYTYAWRGALLVRGRRCSEASADLDRAVPLDPHYIFSRFERFKARLGLGQLDEAMEDLAAARRVDPKFSWPGLANGSSAAAVQQGKAQLDKAVRARPDLGWLRAWRGRAFLLGGNARRAFAELNTAVRLLPEEAEPRVWRGEAAAGLGRTAEAKRDLEAALRLSPRAWSAHKALADLLASQGKTREALVHMRRVTALAPTTVSHFVERSVLESALNRTREALSSLERALELQPRYALALALSARARWTLGDTAGAERDAEAALASHGAPALAYIVRAALRGTRGDYRGQAADLRRALELEPALFTPDQRHALAGV